MPSVIALLSGILFGVGLTLSGLMDPAKVQNFLDVSGTWDPSLALVMGGGLAVAVLGQWWGRKRKKPMLALSFNLPTRSDVDWKLVLGAALFGIGWGVGGFCPGPALANMALARSAALLFGVSMLIGIALYRTLVVPLIEGKPVS